MEYRINLQARGMRIIIDEERDSLFDRMRKVVRAAGYRRIWLPTVEPTELYINKLGAEIDQQLYSFPDKKNRALCLRPEGTATVQALAREHLARHKNVKLWYFEKCYRYERPQKGRYREFFQFGVEVLNSTCSRDEVIDLAELLVRTRTTNYEVRRSVKRGLGYYTEDGFEIICPELGAEQQVVGGGRYAEGIGFGVGFDRLILTKEVSP